MGMTLPLLLDTHALLWWMMDDPRLPVSLRERIANTEQVVHVSAASVWEIAIKTRKGRLRGTEPYLRNHSTLHRSWGFLPVSIESADAAAAGALELPHGDPFDRMLVAQAQRLGADLATRDQILRQCFARAVWD